MNGKFRKLTMSLVLQYFWDDNASVVKKAVFSDGSSLSAQTYSSLADVQKFINLRPFIVSRHANNRLKEERVFYFWHVSARIEFSDCCSQSSQNWRRCQKIFVLKFSWWIQGWTPVVVFQHHDGAFMLFPLVSSRALYIWLLNYVGITMKSSWTPLNHMVNPPAPFTH
jgi:hypothetical protein